MEATTYDNLAHPELEGVTVSGMTRQAFLLRGALAAGAVYGLASVSPFVRQALAEGSPAGDLDILNFALTLEYLEADFYNNASRRVVRSPKGKALVREIARHETEHVQALAATIKKLGGTPVASPTFNFPVTDEASFFKLAQTLEDTGVSAYNGAGPLVQNKDVLGAAGSIVQVEARHAAAIRLMNKVTPAPDAFDKALDKAAVLGAVKPLIKA